jgi:hypothetical protein
MDVAAMQHFKDCYDELASKLREAKRAFKAVLLHLKKTPRSYLSSSDRRALKQLRAFWAGPPMRHTQKELYDIKPLHVLNGRKGSVKPLWDAYIEAIMAARCMTLYMAHRFHHA